MKTKMNIKKIFASLTFTFICIFSIGVMNVNAETLVTDEDELRAALSGEDPSITEVKLGKNIEITDSNLDIYVVNDLTLDLGGFTIDGKTNRKKVYIYYGKNSTNTTGSLTIKDSSPSKAGTFSLYDPIIILKYTSGITSASYKLTIDGGKYDIYDSSIFQLSGSNYALDFTVSDGYFVCSGNGIFLHASDMITNNINLKVNLNKLTLKSSNARLVYSYEKDFKISDVVSESSKINLKYSLNGKEAEITDRTVSVTEFNALNYAFGTALGDGILTYYFDTIEIVKTEGFDVSDVTLNETYGYTSATAEGIRITNRGANPLKVKTVSVSNTDGTASTNFIVNDTVGTTDYLEIASLDSNDTRYTIKAKAGLDAGEYTAIITVTDENDKTYTATVKVVVAKKPIEGLGIGYDGNWKYGETPATLNKYGVDDLTPEQYVVEYAMQGSNIWSKEVPTLVGNYVVRIRVTDTNYDNNTISSTDFSIIPNDTEYRIVPNDHEWTYDGSSHSDDGYKVWSGSIIVTTLLNGDTINAVITGSVRDVADTKTANNTITSYTITNSDGVDVTDCYSNIIEAQGTLTIKPIVTPIVVTAGSDTKEYDGTALEKDSYTYTNDVLLDGDVLTATIEGSQTYVGQSDNKVKEVKVMRDGKDITSNYTFGTHINGTLKVTAVDQPLSIADQYVIVNGKLSTSALKQELTGAYGMVSFEVKSGTAGEYNDELYGGFNAGSSTGDVVMTAKATSFDVNNDGTSEYKEATKDFTIHVVTKETVTIGGIDDNQEFTYDDSTHTPLGTLTFSNSNVTTSDLEISYAGRGSTTYSGTTAPTNAGTYSVTYKIKDSNENYAGAQVFNFTINKAQLPKVTLVKDSFEYTGEYMALEFNNFDSNLMTLLSGYGEAAPQVKNANSYDFNVSLKDKNNYEWADGTTDDIPLTVVVTKANPSYSVPTNLTGLKGQTLEDIELPYGFTWNDASTTLVVGTHTYKATYTPEDTANYNVINNIEISVVTKNIFNVTTEVVGGNGEITTSYTNVVEGSTKVITFTPNTGYMIDKVLVNDVETSVTGNKLTLVVNENKEVKVSYKKIPFTIKVVDTEGATITPNGSVAVNYGDNKEFTITTDSGYRFIKVLVNGVDKTDEMSGDTLTLNNITASMEIKVVVERIVYEVIEGANQKYTITKDTEAKFRIDAYYGMFEDGGKVYVDDELVDEDNYTSEEGSTIITLKQSYVDTLSVGEHTLKVVFADDGIAITNFTIAEVVQELDNPTTGDNILLYITIGILSVIGLIVTSIFVIRRKQEN